MLQTCRYCDKQYPAVDFGVAATINGKIYRRRKCRYCYRDTKRLLIARRREWLKEYKKQKQCVECGTADYRVLDFHHRGTIEKGFNIADYRYKAGFKKLKEELEKCSVLCANCHRILHHEEGKI